jgi:hypothetical protein
MVTGYRLLVAGSERWEVGREKPLRAARIHFGELDAGDDGRAGELECRRFGMRSVSSRRTGGGR